MLECQGRVDGTWTPIIVPSHPDLLPTLLTPPPFHRLAICCKSLVASQQPADYRYMVSAVPFKHGLAWVRHCSSSE